MSNIIDGEIDEAFGVMNPLEKLKAKADLGPFYNILDELWNMGQESTPRGLRTKELTNYHYVLPPRVRFMSFDHRKLRLDYVKQEFLWYLVGDRYDTTIAKLASMWASLINGDGSINSNYGYYIFNPEAGNNGRSNFWRVVDTLTLDPDSRRAAIAILGNDHLNSVTNDYPCTCYVNFHIRNNSLHLYARMRSQDAIFGMGNDAPFFSLLQEMVLAGLKFRAPERFKDLELGFYHHSADSFHVYEKHFEMMENILADPVVSRDHDLGCPIINPEDWVDLSLTLPSLRDKPYSFGLAMDANIMKWATTRDDLETLIMPRKK